MLLLTKPKGHKSIAIMLKAIKFFFEFIRTYSNIGQKQGHFALDDPVSGDKSYMYLVKEKYLPENNGKYQSICWSCSNYLIFENDG